MKPEDVSVEHMDKAIVEVVRQAKRGTRLDAFEDLMHSQQFVRLGRHSLAAANNVDAPDKWLGVILSSIILGMEVGLKLAETQPGESGEEGR